MHFRKLGHAKDTKYQVCSTLYISYFVAAFSQLNGLF
uniref:Uncharacterized protein n=1 Tax=Siphoviridae sp. ctLnD25 TaxID=2827850 RepID=A0A8S5SS22_9CAUD|nr:MAG TPA: hypothetical protein [Siphoviridae sp. ctLnD25]